MRAPPLTFSAEPTFSNSFCDDPWEEDDDTHRTNSDSARSSRTSSIASDHVLPEAAFKGSDGRYLVDPYMGKRDVATLCSDYLIKEFHSSEETATSKRLGQPKLSIFIAQTIYLTGAPYNAVISALILLQRFRAKLPAESSLSFSGHMLWLGALIISCIQDNLVDYRDEARSARYWSNMTRFSEREVDEVYREVWDELEGNVTVFPSYASALEKLRNPIRMLPSWDNEHLWGLDGDDEDDDAESSTCSDVVLGDDNRAHKRKPTCTQDSSSHNPGPKGKSKTKGLTSSPASSRTRAAGSRLVSLFKWKV